MRNIKTKRAAGRRTDRLAAALAALVLLAAWPGPARAQQEQDDIDEPTSPSRMAQVPRSQVPGRATAELNAALSRLARDPRNVSALVDAGQAALHMGDTQAALGFYTRADQVSPNNARIKIQIGSALVLANEPADAVKYFDAAESANADLTSFALDRGLAYDLLGDNRQAQGWYQVALSRGINEEATLRYAISLAIAHDLRTAETLLSPLIQKQNRAAWRARTFALAMNGDETQAVSISRVMMPAGLAEGIAPYLRYMPRLTRSQQAAAANLGRFPRAADIGHDDSKIMAYAAAHPEIGHGLVPVGAPLGAVASNKDTRTSRAKRRVPGRDDNNDRSRASAGTEGDLALAIPSADGRRSKDRGKPANTSLALATTAQTTTAQMTALATVRPPASTPLPPSPSIPMPTVRSVLDGPPVRGNAPLRSSPSLAPRPAQIVAPRPMVTQPATQLAPATTPVVRNSTGAATMASKPTQVALPPIKPAPSPIAAPPQSVIAATIPAPRPALLAGSGPAAAAAPVPKPTAAPSIAAVVLPPSTAALASGAGAEAAPRPVASTTFDLGRFDPSRAPARSVVPAPAPAPAPATAQLVPSASPTPAPASTTPPANDFGSAFGGFTPPPTERQAAVAAVDLSQIKPVRRRPGKTAEVVAVAEEPAPTTLKGKAALKARLKARGERPDGPLASRSGDEDEAAVTIARGARLGPKARKAALEAEALAQADAKRAGTRGKNGKRGAPANPSRIWVQLLTAPNRDAFPREWARITRQAPAIFRGRHGWVTPWGHNYRLLMGPYASDDDAQDALNDLTKGKVRAFVWTSPAGQAIDHLGDGE